MIVHFGMMVCRIRVALAGVEENFKPANVVNMNMTKRLYLVNLF